MRRISEPAPTTGTRDVKVNLVTPKSVLPFFLIATLVASGGTAQLPTASNTITLGLVPDTTAGGRNLLLRIEASQVSDLYGLAFDVKFPKKRLRWKKNTEVVGSFFSEDDTTVTVVLDRQKPRGMLHVGASRLGEVPGVSGSGILIEIGFVNRAKSGPRELTLSEAVAFDSNAEPIPDVIWEVAPFQDASSGD